ncbi:hypothetical protein JCM11641_006709 [Rhodosporidiobolus odoratus]
MSDKHDYTSRPSVSPLFNPTIAALLSAATKVDNLTASIGTELHGIQLKNLTPQQKDELALLVAERGVVFFRDQDLLVEQQVEFYEHYGTLDTHPAQKDTKFVTIGGNSFDHRVALRRHPWPLAAYHADTSFEINPPFYSMLFMREVPEEDGDTLWISQYGTYDLLSPAFRKIASDLHAVHSSRYQYETILTLWGSEPRRAPIDTVHPLVHPHPVTGLRALNWYPGFSIWIDEVNKAESDAVGKLLTDHINEAADHQVRWRWTPNSVAMWDNRNSVHRVIPGKYQANRYGTRMTVFGERPFLNPKSEGREEREERLAKKHGGYKATEVAPLLA